ncbi:hypothetical protein BIV57_09675 [Mangrovactinospora gilvigrisea]|uniref:HTH luxR-type domain-containing protein n=1 Tax=Mangrovactinospora gilvigrisea TaxID=1428644 RepID=A0A1J7C837_9ACTN|nr:LuxR C-terminal-related transcriptional regulator [Mangrovactinospora gilvigrisea]OIV37688.1 hypothetical protein BIV57_09675 [Mangrovactinospora gilvigrisea]
MTVGAFRRRPGELPRELNGFVGRTAELGRMEQLLESRDLVTVVGPGGVGKTRLALRAAAPAAARMNRQPCLAELSALRDPALLPHTLCVALGLPAQDVRDPLAVLIEHLQSVPVLLILDTCEHLIEACAELTEALLRACGEITVLATSRRPLDVPGETTFALAPLGVAEQEDGGDALLLFEQRAAAVVPGFRLEEGNRAQVARLCRSLDGIPLAIELATVRLRAVPLEQLADRIEDRFRLLGGSRRAAVPRHQTLRSAIDWSFELCTPREQILWARLSVFAGDFDIVAAEQVCGFGALPGPEVMEVLIELVDKSVVTRVDQQDGTARYRLLDTLREYGAEKAAAGQEQDQLRHRHLTRYVEMADEFDRHFTDSSQMDRFHALRGEHPDIRLALEFALTNSSGHTQRGAGLAGALWGYWQISGLLSEGRYWQEKVAERFPGPTAERAWALIVGGFITIFQGRPDLALQPLHEGIALADQLGEALIRARGLLYVQCAHTFLCDFDKAEAATAAAQERLAALGDFTGLVSLDVQAGYLYHLEGDADRALERANQGLARLGPESTEAWLRGFLHTVAGLAYFAKGDPDRAEQGLRTALPIKAELGDVIGIGYCLEGMAWLAADAGRYIRAAWLLGASDAQWQQTGARLSGTPVMEDFHRLHARSTQVSLGEEAFEAHWHAGAHAPIGLVVEAALGGAERLADAARAAADPVPGPRRATGRLTHREEQVARLAAEGRSNREIAEDLVISRRTVDAHMERVLAKLGIDSRRRIGARLASTTEE